MKTSLSVKNLIKLDKIWNGPFITSMFYEMCLRDGMKYICIINLHFSIKISNRKGYL